MLASFKLTMSLKPVYTMKCTLVLKIQAVQILLIASVTPTSFVSNSYRPTPTVRVAARKPHQKSALDLGYFFDGM